MTDSKAQKIQVEAGRRHREKAGVLADQIRKVAAEAARDGGICQHILQDQVHHSDPAAKANRHRGMHLTGSQGP